MDHEKTDPLVNLADNALAEFSIAAEPGRWMVDVMPFRELIQMFLLKGTFGLI